jgi:hypothetical protein
MATIDWSLQTATNDCERKIKKNSLWIIAN